ncbi:hypothetical protein [Roseovarius confluentis]|uniref:hypothetical protein n=1 Tax=Roseovarius confluentis TaxID=1852027 RepID=UPI003C7B1A3F
MRPIGGWREFKATGITNPVRGMLGWVENDGSRWVAAGSSDELHVVSTSGTVTDITPSGFTSGLVRSAINTGYGGGTYGTGTYGTPRDDATTYDEAAVWSLDTWGEYLVGCCRSDGKLYEWQLDTGTAAAAISNAPTSCVGLVATEERFLFALGASGNRRLVAWCDQEDNTTWTPAATNQAGDFPLQTSGEIMQGVRTRGQTLILTNVDAHTATFVGGNTVYSFERIGEACGVISRLGCCVAEGSAFWMGQRSFFQYTGGGAEPLESEVADEVFTNMNRAQASLIWSVTNSLFGEIWWFYPSASSIEVDSYVVYNYRAGHWATGSIDRTAGFDRGTWRYPMWIDSTGDLYEQEYAFAHGGETPFVESGPVLLGAGDRVMVCKNLYPDEETQGEVQGTFKTRFYPNGTEREYGPYDMTNPTSIRFTGRQVRMRLESTGPQDWRVGTMRIDADAGGER